MKKALMVLGVAFAILMVWGCKKERIDDPPFVETNDSLSWSDSIAGQYQLNGISRGSYLLQDSASGNYYSHHYSDTIVDWLLTIERSSTSINIVRSGNNPLILDLKQLDADSSVYSSTEGYSTYNMIFRNDDVKSVLYKVSTYTHTSSDLTILEGAKAH